MNGFDVGMIQLRERKSFLAKPLARAFVGQHAGGKNLHGHIAVKLFVMGAVHHSHSAGAQLIENFIVAENLADHEEATLAWMLGRTDIQVNAHVWSRCRRRGTRKT